MELPKADIVCRNRYGIPVIPHRYEKGVIVVKFYARRITDPRITNRYPLSSTTDMIKIGAECTISSAPSASQLGQLT